MRNQPRQYNFTLFDLSFLVAGIGILLLLLAPLLRGIIDQSKLQACKNNIFNLSQANIMYAGDFGRFVPGAVGERLRWHGVRASGAPDAEINISKGPLYGYFESTPPAPCPELARFVVNDSTPASERGGFGYGYNLNIGSNRYFSNAAFWQYPTQSKGVKKSQVINPGRTVMFTDTATLVDNAGETYVAGEWAENAFCASPQLISKGKPFGGTPNPTIHFRHGGETVVSWVDGHCSEESATFSEKAWAAKGLGFFGPYGNELFAPADGSGQKDGK